MKKAFLATYYVTTRVIVDTEGKSELELDDAIHDKAYERITDPEQIANYICIDNMEHREDTELPAGELSTD